MKIQCAWCKKDMGEKPPYEDKGITHSICPECKAKYFPAKKVDISQEKSPSTHPLVLKRFPYPAPEKMKLGFEVGELEVPIPPPRGAPVPPKKVKIKVETPQIITVEDYETHWKPKGWELLPIGPTSTWRPDWGEWEAIRDIVQNALDETEAYQWGYDEQGLWIADRGRGVAVADFLLGPPKLKPDYARGRYGEGMKIAALALLRQGYSVHVETVGRELWMVFIERILDTTPTHQLAALYRGDGSRSGTKFHIIGYSGPAYEDRFAVNLPKSSIIWEGPGIVTQPKQRFNQLIIEPSGTSRIYARDIYMRDIDSPYSYNLWGFAMAPDRHAPADEKDVWIDIGRLWSTVNKVSLLENFLKMVTDPPILRTDESHQVDMSSYDMGAEPVSRIPYANFVKNNAKAWRKAWVNVMGEGAVIRTSDRLDNIVKHLGYKSVGLNWGVREILKAIIKTDVSLKTEQQERLQETEVIPDEKLDPQQMAHLKLARAITKKVFPFRLVSAVYAGIIPPASDRTRTTGLYGTSTQAVYIALDQLYGGRTTIDTLVHELGHHKQYLESGSAEDLVKSHAEAMTNVAAQVVQIVTSPDAELKELLKEVSW